MAEAEPPSAAPAALRYDQAIGELSFVQVPIPEDQSKSQDGAPPLARPKLILCVDVSGSMSGEPCEAIKQVLTDLRSRNAHVDDIWLYNQSVMVNPNPATRNTLDWAIAVCTATGGTDFSNVFRKMEKYICSHYHDVRFVFMTDGQDGSDANAMVSLTTKACSPMMRYKMTVHTLGFGNNVNAKFLANVSKIGNVEGVFQHATVANELTTTFHSLIELSSSTNDLQIAFVCDEQGQTAEVHKVQTTTNVDAPHAQVLVPTAQISRATKVVVTVSGASNRTGMYDLQQQQTMTDSQALQMLHLFPMDNEDDVRLATARLNTLAGTRDSGNMNEADASLYDMLKERFVEQLDLYEQFKMGAMPESVRLKLQALNDMRRMPAGHAVSSRQALKEAARFNKNADHFVKNDIPAKLKALHDTLKQPQNAGKWDEIRGVSQQWPEDLITRKNLYETMRQSDEGILCLAIDVERNRNFLVDPALRIRHMDLTLISFKSFVDYVQSQAQGQVHDPDAAQDHQLRSASGQPINALVPLYLHPEHWERVRLQQGLLFGHLFTGVATGYNKNQEEAYLKLVVEVVRFTCSTTTEGKQVPSWARPVVEDMLKVCAYFMTQSVAFATSFGANTYAEFRNNLQFRGSSAGAFTSLEVLLVMAYVKQLAGQGQGQGQGQGHSELALVATHVLHSHCRRVNQHHILSSVGQLIYGNKHIMLVPATPAAGEGADGAAAITGAEKYGDYVEQSFAAYFFDPVAHASPVQLIPESEEAAPPPRKAVAATIEPEILAPFRAELPPHLADFVSCFAHQPLPQIDEQQLRLELLATLNFSTNSNAVATVTNDNILQLADEHPLGQGPVPEQRRTLAYSKENTAVVVNKMVETQILEAFGGLLLRYCPNRNGFIFDATVARLLHNQGQRAGDKLAALLSNKIGNTTLYRRARNDLWVPLMPLAQLKSVVGDARFQQIEREHLLRADAVVLHTYRNAYATQSSSAAATEAAEDPKLRQKQCKGHTLAEGLTEVYESLGLPPVELRNRHGYSNNNPCQNRPAYPFRGYRDLTGVAEQRDAFKSLYVF